MEDSITQICTDEERGRRISRKTESGKRTYNLNRNLFSSVQFNLNKMEVMQYDGGAVLVRVTERDGHCLFSAIVNQMHHTDVRSREHYREIWETRRLVVEHITKNMQAFHDILMAHITDPDIIIPGNTEAEKINAFLRNLATTAEWGGVETIIAASQMWHKRIDVFNERGNILQFNQRATINGVLRIAYRLSIPTRANHGRNHYDSVVQRLNVNNIQSVSSYNATPNRPFNAPLSNMEAWQRNPNVDTSQISYRSETIEGPDHEPTEPEERGTFKFASWNIRGCSTDKKRNQVDQILKQQKVKLAAIQETRLPSCSMTTKNYIWYNVNNEDKTRQREGGGTAIIIDKAIHVDNMFRKISSNSASYLCEVLGQPLLFISTYIRPVTNEENGEFASLIRYVLSLPQDMQNKMVLPLITLNLL